jgi:4-amino-4-deoxy-L-arabinose transferase-like glycosyltransferase
VAVRAGRYEVLGFWAVLLGALLLRLPHINDSLWFDEIWRTRVALAGDSLWFVLFHSTHPPLFALILWGWINVFGDSEIAVRVPSLLCGLAALAVTYGLARSWFGPRVALLVGLLVALSPAHIWYSRENKNNMLLVLLTVTAVWALDRAWRSHRRRDWWLFLIASVLSLWTNLFAVWIVSATCLWLWFQALRRPRQSDNLRRAAVATTVTGAAFLPLRVWDAMQFHQLQLTNYLRPFTVEEVYKLLLIYLSHGNTLRTLSPYVPLRTLLLQPAAFFLLDAFFACLLLGGLTWIITHRRPHAAPPASVDSAAASLLLYYCLVPLLGVLAASHVYAPIYIDRSMLILLPPYVMLLAVGVHAAPHRGLRWAVLVALLTLNGWAVFNLLVAKVDTWTVYKPKNDWRAAAHYLAAETENNATPLLIVATAPASVLVYYEHRFVEVFEPDDAGPQGAKALIKYVAGTRVRSIVDWLQRRHAEVCYLVEDSYWDNGFQMLLAAVSSDPGLELLTKRTFKGVNVFKFRWSG